MVFPANIFDVYDVVKSMKMTLEFLQNVKIVNRTKKCRYQHDMILSISNDNARWVCCKKTCRLEVGIRVGTWFESSRLSFDRILLFIYCWAVQMSNVEFCKRELGINHNTTVEWNKYMREVCAEKLLTCEGYIGGEGLIVELDEAVFTPRKPNPGRQSREQWVFGGICHETSDCFLVAVEDTTVETLLTIVVRRVAPGSTIISNKWAVFHGIRTNNVDYTQLSVNCIKDFIVDRAKRLGHQDSTIWAVAKRMYKKHQGKSSQLLDSYMCEFMWRKSLPVGADPFMAILKDIALLWPPKG